MLVFVVDISGYAEGLLENRDVDCMKESLMLFESMCNSDSFSEAPIILFFTKIDKLVHKIKAIPLENTFHEYSGGNNIGAAKVFITQKFLSLIRILQPHICVSHTSLVESPRSMARVVSNVIEYLMKDPNTYQPRSSNPGIMKYPYIRCFTMGEDGIARYWSKSIF